MALTLTFKKMPIFFLSSLGLQKMSIFFISLFLLEVAAPNCGISLIESEDHSGRVGALQRKTVPTTVNVETETKLRSGRKTIIDNAGNLANFNIGLSEVQRCVTELNNHGGNVIIKLIEKRELLIAGDSLSLGGAVLKAHRDK